MNVNFPRVPRVTGNQELGTFLTDIAKILKKELEVRTPDTEARESVFLLAPDKSVWKVTISNAGALQTVKVQG